MILYTVQSGDNLYEIAKKYQTDIATITEANGIKKEETLIVGQSLVIPVNTMIHVVQKGDSLYAISQKYHTSIAQLLDDNPYILPPYVLYPGQQIMIRNDMDQKRPLTINGYLFPKTNADYYVPNATALTFGSIFGYHISEEGNLLPLDDTSMIANLEKHQIAPIMTVTNTTQKGSFSTPLASAVLESKTRRTQLAKEILSTLQKKGYVGVNIDFEYVDPKNKNDYVAFLRELKDLLKDQYELSVALAPKYSASQEGLLYEAHDYEAIGKIVDRVILMTYEWGYTYGPAMAVAPIHLVEKVVRYAVEAIPPEKLNLGVPTYGYDFIVPYQKGNKARSLSYEDAIALARKKKASILFDETSKTPYFIYYETHEKHEVHFEDARSISEKIDLALRYRLLGLSFWTLRSPFEPMWSVINESVDVVKY